MRHTVNTIDWTELDHGDRLTKFVAKDEGGPDGDYSVELHGFVGDSGKIYITDEIISKPKQEK